MFGDRINYKCIQKYDPTEHERCGNGSACGKCGWNIDVHNQRVREINANGLTLCEDGLSRLVIKHNA